VKLIGGKRDIMRCFDVIPGDKFEDNGLMEEKGMLFYCVGYLFNIVVCFVYLLHSITFVTRFFCFT